jgi:hypothetical protein
MFVWAIRMHSHRSFYIHVCPNKSHFCDGNGNFFVEKAVNYWVLKEKNGWQFEGSQSDDIYRLVTKFHNIVAFCTE